jgi:hypothetical protein
MNKTFLYMAGSAVLLAGTVMCASPGKPGGGPRVVSNDTCLQCHAHMAFRDEPLTRNHARVGILCADCHGPSAAHVAGGKHRSKPDVVFARAEVKDYCGRCHDSGRHPEKKASRFREQWQGRPGPNGRVINADSVCTDCHGEHVRSRAAKPAAGH